MQDNLKLYVRGFFGSSNMATETLEAPQSRPILSVFDLNQEALQHVVRNEGVVEIYNQMIRRQVIHTDFDFRERSVKIALSAFGVKNFDLWATLNKQSPTFTQTHADFISDTARFITTGKRNLPVGSWESFLAPGSNDPTNTIVFDETLIKSLPNGYSYRAKCSVPENLHTVIAKWLSHPGGFTDMVVSLYTFFGECNTK